MDITLLAALIVVALTIIVSLVVARRRGSLAGVATGLGLLAAAVVGYVVVFSLSLPM